MSDKTKKCPKCGEEIMADAKKCKHCNSDLRNWFNRHPVWTILIIIIAVPAIISSIASDGPTSGSSVSSGNQNLKTVEIISVDTKVTEKNSVWWKYSWVMTLKNNSTRDKSVNAELKWVDENNFVIDSDSQYGLTIPAGQERTFNDYVLIDASPAQSVAGIKAEIN